MEPTSVGAGPGYAKRTRRLADVKRRIAGLVDAIERGIITATTKERLRALEAEKTELEQAPVEQPLPSIHPNLAEMYRGKVARLEQELADPEVAADAKTLLRSIISTIVITPGAKRGQIVLELQGELAAILAMTQGKKIKNGTPPSRIQVSVVAGARNHHYLLFDAIGLSTRSTNCARTFFA